MSFNNNLSTEGIKEDTSFHKVPRIIYEAKDEAHIFAIISKCKGLGLVKQYFGWKAHFQIVKEQPTPNEWKDMLEMYLNHGAVGKSTACVSLCILTNISGWQYKNVYKCI